MIRQRTTTFVNEAHDESTRKDTSRSEIVPTSPLRSFDGQMLLLFAAKDPRIQRTKVEDILERSFSRQAISSAMYCQIAPSRLYQPTLVCCVSPSVLRQIFLACCNLPFEDNRRVVLLCRYTVDTSHKYSSQAISVLQLVTVFIVFLSAITWIDLAAYVMSSTKQPPLQIGSLRLVCQRRT